jgi:hypothetical protein
MPRTLFDPIFGVLLLSMGFASAFNDVDGAFSLPSNNYDLRADWGRASFLQKQFNTGVNSRLPFDVYLTTSVSVNSGSPYNVYDW